MTRGHKHRVVHLGHRATRLLRTELAWTKDYSRVERSRWVWGHAGYQHDGSQLVYRNEYVLTVLGVLHTLFGLTVCTAPKKRCTTHPAHRRTHRKARA